MLKDRNKSIKIIYKAKIESNSQKGTKQLKLKDKSSKKEKKKENRKRKRKKLIKTQLKTMVGILNAAETGAMKLV